MAIDTSKGKKTKDADGLREGKKQTNFATLFLNVLMLPEPCAVLQGCHLNRCREKETYFDDGEAAQNGGPAQIFERRSTRRHNNHSFALSHARAQPHTPQTG